MESTFTNGNGHGPVEEISEPESPTTEHHSYDYLFPVLPCNNTTSVGVQSTWGSLKSKTVLRPSVVTKVFRIPVKERLYRGKDSINMDSQRRLFEEIALSSNTTIEFSIGKDDCLIILANGRDEDVQKARRMIMTKMQTQSDGSVKIPKEYHKIILGKGGKRLQALETDTATRISLPGARDELDDTIRITGTKEGIDQAIYEIQKIYSVASKLGFERIVVPKRFHPFISGPDNETIAQIQNNYSAKVSVPSQASKEQEIIVSGEKEGVAIVSQLIRERAEELERICRSVRVNILKAQHRYLIGTRGAYLSHILRETGCSVEVPRAEDNSGSITIYGAEDKLGKALTLIYERANAIVTFELTCPAWLHRHLIGKKGAKLVEFTENYPKVHVNFSDKDMIKLEGPKDDCIAVREALQTEINRMLKTMARAEVKVDRKFHSHIIGKNGAFIGQVKNETGVQVTIPDEGSCLDVIIIEGDKEGVEKAKKLIGEKGEKLENEVSRDIIIEHRFHRQLIGQNGQRIKELRDMFPEVQVNFPDSSKESDIVTLRGPKNQLDQCYKALKGIYTDMLASNHQVKIHIFKEYHGNVVGKGGSNVRKIRDETGVKIDLPPEGSLSDEIVLTGYKDKCEAAATMIENIQKQLVNLDEQTLEIPKNLHQAVIGTRGALIKSVSDDCGGVIISFPPEGSKSTKVTIRGPKDDVAAAKVKLQELANVKLETNQIVEVRAKPEIHRFLIGRNGLRARKLRDETGARIVFPSSVSGEGSDVIIVIGTKEAIEKGKKILEQRIAELANIVDDTIDVDPKWHKHFVARRAEVIRSLADEFGQVQISLPKQDSGSSTFELKGAKECLEGVKVRILEIVSDLENQVSVDVAIPARYTAAVLRNRAAQVRDIEDAHKVRIKFPERQQSNKSSQKNKTEETAEVEVPSPLETEENKDALLTDDAAPETVEVVESETLQNSPEVEVQEKMEMFVISGLRENCELAKQELLALVPVTEEFEVPSSYHRLMFSRNHTDLRTITDQYAVNIRFPTADNPGDIVKITGVRKNVEGAKVGLTRFMKLLDEEEEDRKLRSFTVELRVDPTIHHRIKGQRGANVDAMSEKHGVQISFPRRDSEEVDLVTIRGYEEKVRACEQELNEIVRKLESEVVIRIELDHRIHNRIIGGRGKLIRKVMDDFRVYVRFPDRSDAEPDVVHVSGEEEDVCDCVDHLKNLEEEYLLDFVDRSWQNKVTEPPKPKVQSNGDRFFHVTGAPWQSAPNTNNQEEFPTFGNSEVTSSNVSWGPLKKRF